MSNVELPSKKSVYSDKGWSVVGLNNGHIIATGIFFYDVVNIARCSLEFREFIDSFHYASTRNGFYAFACAYDVEGDLMGRTFRTSQELGGIDIKDGLCVVFPNAYQYKMPWVMREISSNPGHCKMLTFYYVDPSKHIPSTEIVPPQQGDWWMEQVLTSKPLCNLPLFVVDGIMDKIDYPISLKNAKQICLEMEAEVKEKTANVSSSFLRLCTL
ncbi:hypothetical protein IWW57_003779 [Coemansia sp. S610]|nr:hypothetical protein IWW57_003779 [Coemansia sp. S610]